MRTDATYRSSWHAVLFLLLVLAVGLGFSGRARAQNANSVTITAAAEPNPAGTEETVIYTLRIEGATLNEITLPDPPLTTGLALERATPSTRRSISFSDGRLTRRVIIQWTYRPLRAGRAAIYPVKLTVKNRTYTTEQMALRIVPQQQRAVGTTPASRGSDARPYAAAPPPSLTARDVFIQAVPSARRVFRNEQLVVEYRLYFREGVRLRHSRMAEAWEATGFWREELDVEARPIPRPVTIEGRAYQMIVLKRAALFPTQTGTLWIDPLQIKTEARARPSYANPYDMEGFETLALSSDSLRISVKPLPDAAPADFQGAVGRFTMEAALSTDEAAVGRPLDVRVQIQGTGNLATLAAPPLALPASVEAFAPDIQTTLNRRGEHLQGTKSFVYSITPQTAGPVSLPPVSLTYFDPEAVRYRTIQQDLPVLTVAGRDVEAPATSTTGDGLPVDDIAGLMPHAAAWVPTDRVPLYQTPWPYAALLAPLLIAGGLLALRRRTLQQETAAAPQDARRHLRAARTHLASGTTAACYDAIERALLRGIETRLNVPTTGLTRAQLETLLAEHGVSPDLRADVRTLLDTCDRGRFAPDRPTPDDLRAALRRAETLLDALDPSLSAD